MWEVSRSSRYLPSLSRHDTWDVNPHERSHQGTGTVLATSTCRFCRAELGICNPSASNTKPDESRVPEKINTRVTRMKRLYPAHGGTTTTMIIQAQ